VAFETDENWKPLLCVYVIYDKLHYYSIFIDTNEMILYWSIVKRKQYEGEEKWYYYYYCYK